MKINNDNKIQDIPLYQATQQRYLNYALSVITSRALPDLRDGLKPVQRRILYGMNEAHLSHESKHKKSAQIVGSVMGRYHPHGDSAIYDAMVRMAQDFSMRYCLVDGQGNFGSIDGDEAAAMRYTEARLTALASLLLSDLSDQIVDFRPNYDGSLQEPSVLPAAFPALLVNGSKGIAVGVATNIPPHNLSESIDASIFLIDNPDASLDEVLKIIVAPDFPTGGCILNSYDEIYKIYQSGQGSLEIRGDYKIESEGGRQKIIFSSVPYGQNKAKIVEKIAEDVSSHKLPLVVDIRDESSDVIRIVCELKKGADPQAVLSYIFKNSDMQTRFNINLTCLVQNQGSAIPTPERLGLIDIIKHFLDFRKEIVNKRLRLKLSKLLERIHILEGFAKIFNQLDVAIQIIRESEDKKDASFRLQSFFKIDELQADAILEMRLYKLAKLEIDTILAELKAKEKQAEEIQKILESDAALWKLIKDELNHIKQQYGDERRTKIGAVDLTQSYTEEDYIIEEDAYVIITREALIKRQKSFSDVNSIRTKDGDEIKYLLFGSTRNPLIIFSSAGKAYTLLINDVPQTTGHGQPIQACFSFEDGEKIVGAYVSDPRQILSSSSQSAPIAQNLFDLMQDSVKVFDNSSQNPKVFAMTAQGLAIQISLESFESVSTTNGRSYMRLNEGDEVIRAEVIQENSYVCLITKSTRALVFKSDEINVLKSAGKGIKAISTTSDDPVLDFKITNDESDGLEVTLSGNRNMIISARRFPGCSRAQKGRPILRRGTVTQIKSELQMFKKIED